MNEKKRVELHVVIDLIIRSTDKGRLIEEFSKDPFLFGPILREITNGRNSSNYHVLKKLTKNNKIIEQFVVEQARLILSQISPYELRDDYKIQDGYHTDSTEEIGRSQSGIASKKFIYSVSSYVAILIMIFYLFISGWLFHLFGERGEITKNVGDKKELSIENTIQTTMAKIPSTSAMKESSSAKLKRKGEEVITPQPKEVKSTKPMVAQDVTEYSIKDGDNLWTVARRFKTSVKNIKAINYLKTDKLNIGDVLIIPQRIHKKKVLIEGQVKAKEEFTQSQAIPEVIPEDIKHPENINQTEVERIRLKLLNPSEVY